MPTYEYACSKCKTSYELREGFDAPTSHPCQECGKGTAKRVLYAPPVVFKGSGWYATDSRSKSSARVESAADAASTDSGASGTSESSEAATPAKTESKPAETKSESPSAN